MSNSFVAYKKKKRFKIFASVLNVAAATYATRLVSVVSQLGIPQRGLGVFPHINHIAFAVPMGMVFEPF